MHQLTKQWIVTRVVAIATDTSMTLDSGHGSGSSVNQSINQSTDVWQPQRSGLTGMQNAH